MGYEWYVFDVAGVLIDTRHLIRKGLYRFLKGMVDYHELKNLYNLYSVGRISQEEFNEVVPRDIEDKFLRSLRIRREALEVLEELRRRRKRIGIITNMPSYWARHILRSISHVDLSVTSGEVGVRKPDPEIFRIFLEKSKARPQDILFIDDRLDNLETAAELGMNTAMLILHPPGRIISSLEEIL